MSAKEPEPVFQLTFRAPLELDSAWGRPVAPEIRLRMLRKYAKDFCCLFCSKQVELKKEPKP